MIAVAALIALASQAADLPLLDVETAKRELAERDGEVVRVRGWVSERCYALGCSLLPQPHLERDGEPSLSIHFELALEPALQATRGHEVVIEGALDAACLRAICTDRAPELRPRRIWRVEEPSVAPRP